MINRIKIVIILIVIVQPLYGNNLDSLINSFDNSKSDTKKVNQAILIAIEYLNLGEIKSALGYVEKVIKLERSDSIQHSLLNLKIECLLELDLPKAEALIFDLSKDTLSMNSRNKAELYRSYGTMFFYKSDFLSTSKFLLKSIKYYEKIGSNMADNLYGNLGVINFQVGDYVLAEKYYRKSINKFNEKDIWFNLANLFMTTANYDSALVYCRKSLTFQDSIISTEINNFTTLGSIYAKKKEYIKGLTVLEKVNEYILSQSIIDSSVLMVNLQAISYIYFSLKNPEKAIKYGQKSLLIAKKRKNMRFKQVNYDVLAESYTMLGDISKASTYYKKLIEIKDSTYNIKKTQSIQDVQAKYETEKKEAEITLLNTQNDLQKIRIQSYTYGAIGVGALVLLGVISGLFIYRRKKDRNEKEVLQLEQKLLRTQMNPHFIFNSLTTIRSYLFENKIEDSALYLTKFAKLMRNILESSREEFITLETEIAILTNFLELHKLRLGEKLSYNIYMDDEIDETDVMIPPMLLQPFIENAVEHGIESLNGNGKISVDIGLKENILSFNVADNGIGIGEVEVIKEDGYKSYAIDITKERIKNIKRNNKKDISFDIINLGMIDKALKGTKVEFLIQI